jgi:hypothetical protein
MNSFISTKHSLAREVTISTNLNSTQPARPRITSLANMADQQTDISALPIDKQMEHILRSRLDVQELVSLPSHAAHSEAAAADTDGMHFLLLLLLITTIRKSPTSQRIVEIRFLSW